MTSSFFFWGGERDSSVPSPLYVTLDAHLQKESVFCDPLEGLDEVRSQSEAVFKLVLDCLRGERGGKEGEGKKGRDAEKTRGREGGRDGGRKGGREGGSRSKHELSR